MDRPTKQQIIVGLRYLANNGNSAIYSRFDTQGDDTFTITPTDILDLFERMVYSIESCRKAKEEYETDAKYYKEKYLEIKNS